MELTVRDAARILGKSERQVRYLIQTGRLSANKRDGQWKISRDDLPRSKGQQRAERHKAERASDVAAAESSVEPSPRRSNGVSQAGVAR